MCFQSNATSTLEHSGDADYIISGRIGVYCLFKPSATTRIIRRASLKALMPIMGPD